MHFLKMIILKGKLMKFIIYVDNVQQYMYNVHARFTKKIYNAAYQIICCFKKYIDKIYALCNSQFLKN